MSKKNRNQGPALAASQLTGRTAVQETPAPPATEPAKVNARTPWGVRRMIQHAEWAKGHIDTAVRFAFIAAESSSEGDNGVLFGAEADMRLLADILGDWQGGAFDDVYPNESPLVAAIRGNLKNGPDADPAVPTTEATREPEPVQVDPPATGQAPEIALKTTECGSVFAIPNGDVRLVLEVSEFDAESLLGFAEMLRREGDWGTPFEEFVSGLARKYKHSLADGRGVDPDEVEELLIEFRESCESNVVSCREFSRRYAHIIDAEPDPEAEPAVS